MARQFFIMPKEKISKQLGDGKLLSKLTQKTVIYDFRKNDLKNGGHGAPLTPIFHKLVLKKKFKIPCGNIFKYRRNSSNITTIWNTIIKCRELILVLAMCLIDEWVRSNRSKKNYDENGIIAKSGKVKTNIIR